MGIEKTNLSDWDFGQISDYDWMKEYFHTEVQPSFWSDSTKFQTLYMDELVKQLGEHLRKEMGIQVAELDTNASKFFKAVSEGQRRRGASITED
jgi:hypothetical protein